MIAPARLAAYEAIRAVSAGRADLATALPRARAALSDERDRALASEIATGVERWRASLDHLIQLQAKRALSKLDAEVLDILRIALYQLLHLTRVPASAVVDDAVNMTKKAGKGSAAGFVNALLRGLSRSRSALPLPPPPLDPFDRAEALRYLSVTLSHPEWLAGRWLDRLGFAAAETWMQFNNRPSPLTLRVNPRVTSPDRVIETLAAEEIDAHRGAWAPDAVIVPGGSLAATALDPSSFVVQDEASQLIALLAGRDPGPRVLDTCASPGGKTTAIAVTQPPGGFVVAADLRARRMTLLTQIVSAAHLDNVRLLQMDLRQPLPLTPTFDTVLLDAPCSGLGTLRRDPDIKWRRGPDDLLPFAKSQQLMLGHAAGGVRPGGRLIYATCSSEPEENERVAEAFLEVTPGFRPVDARSVHPNLSPALVDERGHLRTTPHQHGLESFFGAIFERD